MVVKIGDIFSSKAKTLVNTVNCVGVMGKGIASEFKIRYPEMYREYIHFCQKNEIKPGKPYYYSDILGNSIINFPTKDHWRSPSRLSYIVEGLNWFRENYTKLGITSIAFPPLGCGNGGLSWKTVGPIMYKLLHDLPIEIEIYAPYGTSLEQTTEGFLSANSISSEEDIIGDRNMRFNRYWLLILYVVQQVNSDKYVLKVGRVIFQKICYILTREGLPTGFNFVQGYYGPFAKEVKEAITVLSNANLMTEKHQNKMTETVVADKFKLAKSDYTDEEMHHVNRAIDLFSRIKSTDHAEMITTVLFSYDSLIKKGETISEKDIYHYVVSWKPRWHPQRQNEIVSAIINLSKLGWMRPNDDVDQLALDEDELI